MTMAPLMAIVVVPSILESCGCSIIAKILYSIIALSVIYILGMNVYTHSPTPMSESPGTGDTPDAEHVQRGNDAAISPQRQRRTEWIDLAAIVSLISGILLAMFMVYCLARPRPRSRQAQSARDSSDLE